MGNFHAAQIKYGSVDEIDSELLARWLKKAGRNIRDMAGDRKKALAKRKKAKKSKS